jgi:hypothetical protein
VRLGTAAQVALRELGGAPTERLVTGAAPAVLLREPGEHPLDPVLLLGRAELRRDAHHGHPAVPVGGHRPPTPPAAADLDRRLADSSP